MTGADVMTGADGTPYAELGVPRVGVGEAYDGVTVGAP